MMRFRDDTSKNSNTAASSKDGEFVTWTTTSASTNTSASPAPTQFFEFIGTITAQFPTDGQTVRVPSSFIQPILSDDVVAALVDVTLGAPVNGIIDLAGPERFRFDEIIRQFLSARTHVKSS